MNQQPDKLFRDKLHGYQQPVNSGAWSRISENIGRRNRRVLWLRVAATVLLLATSGLFIYPALQKNTANPVAQNEGLLKNQDNGDVKSDTANQPPTHANGETPADANQNTLAENIHPVPAVAQHHGRTQADEKKKRTLANNKDARTRPVVETPLPTTDGNIAALHDVMLNTAADETTTQIFEQQPLKDDPTTEVKNVKIVFTAEEVNEKYLTKISDAEATAQAKETSGFKRLLDKAYDLKNNQDLLGDLRQRKNEILAMNFKNEKEHTAND